MNLAIRGIDANIAWNNEGSFLNNAHKDLKVDFVIANPPFNDSDWHGEALRKDGRWKYGTPPTGNANFAWVQHFIHHLSPKGIAGFVLANGSMSSNTSSEGDIRKNIIETDLVDCMIALPSKLFYNTAIPACLWFVSRDKKNRKFIDRRRKVLLIDATEMGIMVDRRHRELTSEDIEKIASTYHLWRSKEQKYNDITGFCKSVTTEEIKRYGYILTPGIFIDTGADTYEKESFEKQMEKVKVGLVERASKANNLEKEMQTKFSAIGYDVSKDTPFSYALTSTLDKIANYIFKHWFVNFEFPNESGRPYRSNHGKMMESSMGEIPEGWEIREVSDCGDVVCGKTPSTKNKKNYGNDIPFITIPDMRSRIFVVKTEKSISKVGAESQKKKELPPLSVCVSCIATPGLVSLTSEISHTNQQINSIICNLEVSPYFMYYTMRDKSEQIKTMGRGGTATLNLNTGNFSKIKLVIPSKRIMDKFNDLVRPIFDQMLFNMKEEAKK